MIGTPYSITSKKLMLLGSGELGKEVIIEAQRLGIETIAVDRYENAPAMQVAHHSCVIDMQNPKELQEIINEYKPDFIAPEIEAINTEFLLELEKKGCNIIPTARAVNLTMNRERIRRLAAEDLGLKTAKYAFAENLEDFKKEVKRIGLPCVIKPIQSSSGKGQSTIKTEQDIEKSWEYAISGSRGKSGKVIIEEFINFDSEITLLTVREKSGEIKFCDPIGHSQHKGDYYESWQPQIYSPDVLKKCQDIAYKVVNNLGGTGIFGCELFIAKDDVYFSEISPRPHDTGMVTMISQNMSEFELHIRAILGLPIPEIKILAPSASYVILSGTKNSTNILYEKVDEALKIKDTSIRLFGKPSTRPNRRMGVCLAKGSDTQDALKKAEKMASIVKVNE